eukprot:CAMPEP_0179268686 /NCGR_PEP_ID=MMETSP0797-20121207/30568_1 /TAXON_ID=47934 /ORGANISM="Dinophysis acuminata, Strain DAEP01" /LENGTH=93 /DNA_ID=CAMNT_0020976975 /DNA_START=64 /DNA_END=345 /DNA_ORIENTATION=+
MAKLSGLRKRVIQGSAATLGRALLRIQRRHLREALDRLRHRASVDTFVHARTHAESMLQRLQGLVSSFDLEVDGLVENIIQGTLEDDEAPSSR